MAPPSHPSLCGITSRRGLLASLWSVVVALTFLAFVVALIFTLSADNNYNNNSYSDDNNGEDQGDAEHEKEQEDDGAVMAVTSRALAFACVWTAVLATLMAIFGAVILGWQSPCTGVYYSCCTPQVHRTTPLALGSFVGALLMLANVTLVCSVLFGEFEIRDYWDGGEERDDTGNTAVGRSSMAFSIMCMFLTVLYAGFAGLTFVFSKAVLEELDEDERWWCDNEANNNITSNNYRMHHHQPFQYSSSGNNSKININDGYIGERFDVRRPGSVGGFGVVAPSPDKSII